MRFNVTVVFVAFFVSAVLFSAFTVDQLHNESSDHDHQHYTAHDSG